jgi:hypothetical protein
MESDPEDGRNGVNSSRMTAGGGEESGREPVFRDAMPPKWHGGSLAARRRPPHNCGKSTMLRARRAILHVRREGD